MKDMFLQDIFSQIKSIAKEKMISEYNENFQNKYENAYKEILGCSKSKFIKENKVENLKELFPQDTTPENLAKFYSSNAYTADLLSKLEYEIYAMSPAELQFINFIADLAEENSFRILCYGNQYTFLSLLAKKVKSIHVLDYPHKVFKIFEAIYPNITFFSLTEIPILNLSLFYSIVFAGGMLQRTLKYGDVFSFLAEHTNLGGIVYMPQKEQTFFNSLPLFDNQIDNVCKDLGFSRFSSANNSTLSDNLLLMKFKELKKNIYIKTRYGSNLKRFKCTDVHVVCAVQKEMLMYTVDSLIKPEISLNIGGPPSEYCKKSIAIDVAGKPHIRGRGESLPILSNSVDLIYSCHSLEHMENTRKTLREWIRVLKKNGILIVIVPILPYHVHGKTKALGERCYEEHTTEEFKDIFEEIDKTTILQFNTKQNKFDIEIILRKDG